MPSPRTPGPDGDAIGSEVALALALRQIGKEVQVVNADRHPPVYDFLPGIDLIEIGGRFTGEYDALIILECSDSRGPGFRISTGTSSSTSIITRIPSPTGT